MKRVGAATQIKVAHGPVQKVVSTFAEVLGEIRKCYDTNKPIP